MGMSKTSFVIISDIHDNLPNLEKCLNWCNKQDFSEMICCGDVTNSETLEKLARGFNNIIHLVKGNVEIYDESEVELYDNIKYHGYVGTALINKKMIGFCHEPSRISQVMALGKCDLIFYGHTHKPWESNKNDTRLINPGTLSGMFQEATFAVADEKGVQLKILRRL